MNKNQTFPLDFLWGAATSAFQAEGGATLDGKGENTADTRCAMKNDIQADTSVAADQYHHIEEDIELMKELGMNSYRFSICWSRIFPNGNDEKPNELGLIYYDKLIKGLVDARIEPIVTLLHFDIPSGLMKQYNSFASRQSIDDFDRYARFLFKRYGEQVKYWLTINEQSVMVSIQEICGVDEDNLKKRTQILQQMNYHLFLANAKAIKSCHELCPTAKIGPAISYPTVYPASCNPEDVFAAKTAQDIMAFAIMDIYVHGKYPAYYLNYLAMSDAEPHREMNDDQILNEGKPDFLGLNWYCTQVVAEGKPKKGETATREIEDILHFKKNPFLEYTQWDWSYDPIGLRIALRECWDRYHLPMLITENGWSDRDVLNPDGTIHDKKRIEYLHDHIEQMRNAIEDGVEMIGYQPWSFIDILSAAAGFSKRYGLVYVDRDEFDAKECKRYKKDSFYYYQNVIKTNGAEL